MYAAVLSEEEGCAFVVEQRKERLRSCRTGETRLEGAVWFHVRVGGKPPTVSRGRSGSRRPGCGKRREDASGCVTRAKRQSQARVREASGGFLGRLVSCLSRREMPPAVSQGRRSSRRPGCGKRRGRFACKPAWLPDAARGPQAAARVTGRSGFCCFSTAKSRRKWMMEGRFFFARCALQKKR